MSRNRTRQGQKQIMSFMIDAGCDPDEVGNYSEDITHSQHSSQKIPLKQDEAEHSVLSNILRHKRIQKPTKRVEKYKLKPSKSEINSDKLEHEYFGDGNNTAKSANGSGENDFSDEAMIEQSKIEVYSPLKKQFIFPECVNKAHNNFYGYFGHSTVLVNESVIEGSYYMEVNILNPSHPPHPKGKQFQSSVRIGLCKNNYRLLVPMGGQSSYCYKSKDGSIIHSNKKYESVHGQQYGPGDTIGVYLIMSPPYRYTRDSNLNNISNIGSRLVFYKNGILSCQVENLEQCFYNLGVSLFNWANVNINLGPNFKYNVQLEHKAMQTIFQEKAPYSDIKNC